MKQIIAGLMLLTAALNTQAQNNEPFTSKTFSSAAVKKVTVRTSGGNVDVTGRTSGESRVEVYIGGSNDKKLSKEEIQQRLNEDYVVDISLNGDELSAIAKPKSTFISWKKSLSISFKVFVGTNVSTDLRTSGGAIALQNLNGNLNFATSGGSLNMDALSGVINGRTSGGNIRITNSKDDINLSTSGGGINADGCKGTIKLNTSGGNIALARLSGTVEAHTSGGGINGVDITADIRAHTSGGNVTFKDLAGSLDASTSGGRMSVELTKVGKQVKLHNSGGHIGLTLPKGQGLNLKLKGNLITTNTLTNFNGNNANHEINGTVNGGGALVEANASNGNMMVVFN